MQRNNPITDPVSTMHQYPSPTTSFFPSILLLNPTRGSTKGEKRQKNLQIIPRHPILPHNIQITNRIPLIELIPDQSRRPGIGDGDRHARVRAGTALGPGEVHPVVGVGVLGVPDAADLEVGVFVDERVFFAVGEEGRRT